MKTKVYLMVSGLIFLLVAIVHLMRLTEGWAIQVGSFGLPVWGSLLAMVISAGIGIWGLSLMRKT